MNNWLLTSSPPNGYIRVEGGVGDTWFGKNISRRERGKRRR